MKMFTVAVMLLLVPWASAEVTKEKSPKVLSLQSDIIGDKEQPKVMTIVPWQKSEVFSEVTVQLVNDKNTRKFRPLDAASLAREMEYFKADH
jgi:protoheme ferro-lyase